MKYLLIVPDGMADLPCPELDGKTPMMAAKKPNMDALARAGVVGSVLTVPVGVYPGSDAANMSILGHDPRLHPCGRGPLEAAAMRIPMEPRDVAFRCSLISTDGERILDHSSGHIANEPAHALMTVVAEKLGTAQIRFYPGVGYRHVMLWSGGPVETNCAPPHDHVGDRYKEWLPAGDGEATLRRLVDDSLNLLYDHPINRRRIDEGLAPANMIWPWGQGRPPQLPNFRKRWGVSGGVVAAVDLIKGLGVLCGLETPDVPGATGYLNTDYSAKARAALELLKRHDFVFVHIEAPDEAGHQGDVEAKTHAISQIDRYIVGPLTEGLKEHDHRILILPDHATPVSTKVHASGLVPFLLYDSRVAETNPVAFDETAKEDSNVLFEEGWRLIERLMA